MLRLANILGPTIDNALTRYLGMPVVPTAAGFDPRLQLLHEDDAIEVLRLATVSARPGVVNVAADGVVTLSQLPPAGRAGARPRARSSAVGLVGALVRNSGVVDFTARGVALPALRTGRRHHPVARRIRLHPPVHHRRRPSAPTPVNEVRVSVLRRLGLGVGSRVLDARSARAPARDHRLTMVEGDRTWTKRG